jgi:hypothetical protein
VFTFVVTRSCVSLDALQRGFEKSFDKAEKVASNVDKQFDAVMQYKASIISLMRGSVCLL